MSVYDQLRFNGQGNADVKYLVGKVARSLQDEWIGVDNAIKYTEAMRATFDGESKEWAVLGCVLNILVGGSYTQRN